MVVMVNIDHTLKGEHTMDDKERIDNILNEIFTDLSDYQAMLEILLGIKGRV
jgi:hypothetical protein